MARFDSRHAKPAPNTGGFHQNVGKAGVVYILENLGLAPGVLKIGCSSRSGAARAAELNREATTGLPGVFRCVAEFRTLDCGRVEKQVHHHLKDHHVGKRGQEFFRVSVQEAKSVIANACLKMDAELARHAQAATDTAAAAAAALKAENERNRQKATGTASVPGKAIGAVERMLDDAQRIDARLIAAQASIPTPDRPAPAPPARPIPPKAGEYGWAIALIIGVVLVFSLLSNANKSGSGNQGVALAATAPSSVPVAPSEQALTVPQPTEEDLKPQPPARYSDQGGEAEAKGALAKLMATRAQEQPLRADTQSSGAGAVAAAQPDRVPPAPAPVSLNDLTADERSSLNFACNSAKFQGPASYNNCLAAQIAEFSVAGRPPNFTALTTQESSSLKLACNSSRFQGPAKYNRCLSDQMAQFDLEKRPQAASNLSNEEQASLQLACSSASFNGPAKLNQCLRDQMMSFDPTKRPPVASGMTSEEQSSLRLACSSASFRGPATLNACLSDQIANFDPLHRPPSTENMTSEEKTSLRMACSSAQFRGPEALNKCMSEQIARFDPTQRVR